MLRLTVGSSFAEAWGSQLREALRRTKRSEQECEKQDDVGLDLIPVPDLIQGMRWRPGACGVKERDTANSLSNHVRLVARLHLEGAVVFPQVYRVGDACDTAFVDLQASAWIMPAECSYYLRRFRARDRELEVGVLLPVAKEERELGEESVEDLSGCGYGLGAGVSVQTALEGLCRTNEGLP